MAEFVAVLVATVVSKFHGGEWKSTLNLLLVLKHLLLIYEALIAYFAAVIASFKQSSKVGF